MSKQTASIHNLRLREIFYGMKKRCYNPNCKNYKYYGDKGINIDVDWISNPHLFEEWALENGYEETLTIDRIDSDGDYCPDNCQWLTRAENTKKSVKHNWITINGITMCGTDWARVLGMDPSSVNEYYRNHGPEQTAYHIKDVFFDKNFELKS